MKVLRLVSSCLAPTLALMGLLSAGYGISLLAQDSRAAVQEPEYNGHFALLGPDGKLVDLEAQKMTIQAKTHNHFFLHRFPPNRPYRARVHPCGWRRMRTLW